MAQGSKLSVSKEVVSLLKINEKGWIINLFEDKNKISQEYLCENCNSVCCDAVELGCDHDDDDDILSYCNICLNEIITQNNNKCPINSHSDAIIVPIRSTRRKISKSIVFCPYSIYYKQRSKNNNDNGIQVIDTIGNDEKEGISSNINNIKGCKWKGTLNELLSGIHLNQCIKQFNPSFTQNVVIKQLQTENKKLNQIIQELKTKTNRVQIENQEKQKIIDKLENEINELKQHNKLTMNESNTLRRKLDQDTELINKLKIENETINKQLKEQSDLIQDLLKSNKDRQETESKMNDNNYNDENKVQKEKQKEKLAECFCIGGDKVKISNNKMRIFSDDRKYESIFGAITISCNSQSMHVYCWKFRILQCYHVAVGITNKYDIESTKDTFYSTSQDIKDAKYYAFEFDGYKQSWNHGQQQEGFQYDKGDEITMEFDTKKRYLTFIKKSIFKKQEVRFTNIADGKYRMAVYIYGDKDGNDKSEVELINFLSDNKV